jgi:serine/threonine-protein kinase
MPPFPYNTSVSSHIAEYQIAEAHQNTPPPPIAKTRKDFYERKNAGKKYVKDYPQWLEEMILKCLNKKPDERFRNGKELHDFILQHTTKNAATPQPEPTPKAQASDPTLLSKIDALHRENTSLKQQLNDDRKTLTATQNDLQAAKTDIFKLQNIINTLSAQLKKNKKNRILHRFLLMLALTATMCCVLLIWHSAADSPRSTKELQEKLEQKQETTVPVEQQENSNSNQTP